MSKFAKSIATLAAVGAAGATLWWAGSALFGDASTAGAKHAVNQVWIERLPANPRDRVDHFVLVRHPEGRIGAIGKSSQWRHHIELFLWGLEGDKLSVFLPQDEVKASLKVRTWECAGEAPKPFELCLELSNAKGRSVTMYSRKDWVIDPGSAADSLEAIADDEPALAGLVAELDGVDRVPSEQDANVDADGWAEVELFAR
jgi:hypothetical protein